MVWVTGLPGSGKSTICQALIRLLPRYGLKAQLLSSDTLRRVITPKPVYSENERRMFYSVLAFAACKLAEYGINVIIDATGNRRVYREAVRRANPRFLEVYVDCPPETCLRREMQRKERFGAPEAIYAKAHSGLSRTVPGFGVAYEKPKNPTVTLNSVQLTPRENAEKILTALLRKIDDWRRA